MFLKRFLSEIRNVAIIAHVDHGKTSLIDQILRQSGLAVMPQQRVLDNNELERERGITILSKNTSIDYNGIKINIIDTPGHADFGGEVERVLSMVNGVVLVCCATEGPMTQTKFVLKKALSRNLNALVVLNKVDRPTANPSKVENDLLELFCQLNASDTQLDYPVLYSSAKEGWASLNPEKKGDSMTPLLDALVDYIPPPKGNTEMPFSLLITQIENDPFVGKCYLGKIETGVVNVGDSIICIGGKETKKGKVTKIFSKKGLQKVPINTASAGDIVSIAGIVGASINDTLCASSVKVPLEFAKIDQPTISINIYANDSPLAGKEGKMLTSQAIKDRLLKELETNVSLQLVEHSDSFELKGRGELQIGVLVETLRREGFELSISPPKVLYKSDPEAPKIRLEPIEEVIIEVSSKYAGVVIEKLTKYKAEMKSYTESDDMAHLSFEVPTRGLLGYPAEFKNDTHGQGVLNHCFKGYEAYKGDIEKVRKGSLISMAGGIATAYALATIEPRGTLSITPGTEVYPGMVIGEHSRDNDLDVNPVKAKQLTNFRAGGKEETIKLVQTKKTSLEQLIAYVQGDEIIEVTPSSLRVRKRILDAAKRKRR